LIQNLKDNCPKDFQSKRQNMISIKESDKRWILHTVEMRDEVTYDSDLVEFECYNQRARRGARFIHVLYPSMPNGRRAKAYIDTIWEKVLSHTREVIKLIVLWAIWLVSLSSKIFPAYTRSSITFWIHLFIHVGTKLCV
jgi:hypothetical protein